VLGFVVRYERVGERFALVERDRAVLMLEQPSERDRLYPKAELAHPYGRGVNFEIEVGDVNAVHDSVRAAHFAITLDLEERAYARAADSVRVRQFAVADPDGYLLRFSQTLGTEAL